MQQLTGFRAQAEDESAPALSLDTLLVRNKSATFFARMSGHAMARSGIRHGDLLVIEAAETYQPGAIVLAYIDHQAIVRRLEQRGETFALVASDSKFATRVVQEDCAIRGQVVAAVTLLARPRQPLPVVS